MNQKLKQMQQRQAAKTGIEEPAKNKLSERIKDITKMSIPKGNVLLRRVEEKSKSGIILLDKNKDEFSYFIVVKTGMEDFIKLHPESTNTSEGITKAGNIIISMRPAMTPILVNDEVEYLNIHESMILSQVTPDNFNI